MGLISRVSSRTYRSSSKMFRQGFRHARRFAAAGAQNTFFQPQFQQQTPQFRFESTSMPAIAPLSISQIVQNTGLASLLESIEGEDDDEINRYPISSQNEYG